MPKRVPNLGLNPMLLVVTMVTMFFSHLMTLLVLW